MSPDSVHLDYVDNRLSKNATIKSIMGGLGGRVQKLTDGGLSPYAVTPTDTLHHLNPLSSYQDAARMQTPDVLNDWLKISSDQGTFYGESAGNLKGRSLDARAHTGGRGKKGTKHNPTAAGSGPDGDSRFSAHPRGTADPTVKLGNRIYGSGQEMFDAAKDIRATHLNDTKIGIAADQTRRNTANRFLREAGVIDADVDAFSADASEATIAKAKKFFEKQKGALTTVAEDFKICLLYTSPSPRDPE